MSRRVRILLDCGWRGPRLRSPPLQPPGRTLARSLSPLWQQRRLEWRASSRGAGTLPVRAFASPRGLVPQSQAKDGFEPPPSPHADTSWRRRAACGVLADDCDHSGASSCCCTRAPERRPEREPPPLQRSLAQNRNVDGSRPPAAPPRASPTVSASKATPPAPKARSPHQRCRARPRRAPPSPGSGGPDPMKATLRRRSSLRTRCSSPAGMDARVERNTQLCHASSRGRTGHVEP
jgi:hypothetical protein